MRYKDELKSYDLTVAEGTVTRPSALAALHWAVGRAAALGGPAHQAAPWAVPGRRSGAEGRRAGSRVAIRPGPLART